MSASWSKVFKLFTPQERKKFLMLTPLMLIMGVINIIGIAFIIPFLVVATNPGTVLAHKKLAAIYHAFHFSNTYNFVFFLGVAALVGLVVSNGLAAFINRVVLRFSNSCGASLAQRLYAVYLSQPYLFFLNRNATDLSKNVCALVNIITNSVYRPAIQLVSVSFGACVLIAILLVVNWKLAISLSLMLVLIYMLIFGLCKKTMALTSRRRNDDLAKEFRLTNESFNGIKEVKQLAKEPYFLKEFVLPSQRFAADTASQQFVGILPRYLIETVAFACAIIIVLSFLHANAKHLIAILTLYALAIYRLMPSLQQIFALTTAMKSNLAVLDTVFNDLQLATKDSLAGKRQAEQPKATLMQSLVLEDVVFQYPGADEKATNHLTLTIPANSTIGIVGTTGAGKTTIIDILLGLLKPQQGQMVLDGKVLSDEGITALQKNIGYVPQFIYLCDDSIVKNIAFGIADNEIDLAAVEQAAKIANIHDFIAELPEGYNTIVGDKGVRLSGGQRQRIGIARALYHNPSILVLDEATSSLDGVTEAVIMEAINKLAHQKTIVMIAHRLTTVKKCDVIYFLEKGKVVNQGTYKELLEVNQQFRAMASEGMAEQVQA